MPEVVMFWVGPRSFLRLGYIILGYVTIATKLQKNTKHLDFGYITGPMQARYAP